jgi:4-hydroxy-2-oxoheptanedioate aldolase
VNGWLAIPSSVTAELMSKQDFDSITVDLQHGLNDYQSALVALQAMAESGVTPMARPPWLEPGIIMKLLDAGALGIVCPMVNTRADAEALVDYTHYAPVGGRSFGPTRAVIAHGADYHHYANDAVITLAMIETVQALENVADIATTPHLTGLYIGPSDLSLSMGYVPKLDQEEPAVLAAIEQILAAAHAAGIKAGIHCLAPAYAKRMREMGFDLVTVSSDIRLLSAAVADTVNQMRD